MKILVFAASLRKASLNRKLAKIAAGLLVEHGAEVDHADFREFDMPLYDGDLESSDGLPAGAQELIRRITGSDGMLISSPEYNASIPGTLKNAIDWVSRASPMPLKDRNILLITASPSLVGGMNCQWAARRPLERLGSFVYPYQFTVSQADKQFDENDQFIEDKHRERLSGVIQSYLKATRALLDA